MGEEDRNSNADSEEPPQKKAKFENVPEPLTNGIGEENKKKKRRKKKKKAQLNGEFTSLKDVSQIAAPVVLVNSLFNDPIIIPQDGTAPLKECDWLSNHLHQELQKQGVTTLFPVQNYVIPHIMETKYAPESNDICVSAPTGSGKTLAYALPIIQNISEMEYFQAIVVVPTRELAVQVHKVFKTYLPKKYFHVELATTGQDFKEEQKRLCKKWPPDVDIPQVLVATPGRLIEHIQKSEGFNLKGLQFLVLDEADRILDGVKEDWIETVQKAITYEKCRKLLFSATLFQNIALLHRVTLTNPKFFTYKGLNQGKEEEDCLIATPSGLKEFYVVTPLEQRALTLHTLIKTWGMKRVLCFTRSKDDSHRLAHVLRSMGGIGKVSEFSSDLGKKRKAVFRNFADGSINVLVSTTSMERGIDLDVQFVILYTPPDNIIDYIHEVGRTARAEATGTAITMTTAQESKDFFKMMKKAKKTLTKIVLKPEDIKQAEPSFEEALQKLSSHLKVEKKSRFKK